MNSITEIEKKWVGGSDIGNSCSSSVEHFFTINKFFAMQARLHNNYMHALFLV